MANAYRMSAPQMRARIEEESSLAELRASMREDKTIAFLMSNAEVADAAAGA
jgi:hypothetical protein